MARRTVARPAEVSGAGLFSGAQVTLKVRPAGPGTGLVFRREDLGDGPAIPARAEYRVAAARRTALARQGHRVDTVEHLLAAVVALEIDDLEVALDGPEVPILDGSFAPFLALLESAGTREAEGGVAVVRLDRAFHLTEGDSRYAVTPADRLRLAVTLEYAEPVIGTQSAEWPGDLESFREEIAPARTFGFEREVATLSGRGALRGATAGAGLLLSADRVLHGALHWPDEFARHKAGDLLGDLALVGARPSVRIEAYRPSHRGNLACVRALRAAAGISEE